MRSSADNVRDPLGSSSVSIVSLVTFPRFPREPRIDVDPVLYSIFLILSSE